MGDGGLLWAFAESSIGEDVGGCDAVVGGGVFVDALSDVVEDLDELESAVGLGENGVGEVECRGLDGICWAAWFISSLKNNSAWSWWLSRGDFIHEGH